jgi:uncharacterized membrane protein YhaH (DUF805 family)
MLAAIRHGLSNLFNFNGRDSRQTFWLWILFIVVLRILASIVTSGPMVSATFSSVAEVAESGADPAAAQAQMLAKMADAMSSMGTIVIVVGLATCVLMAASLVRRLHDAGFSGWLVLIPGAIYGYVLSQVPAQLDLAAKLMRTIDPANPPNPMAMMQGTAGIALIGWIPVLFVIVVGILKSSDGPNAYGDAPVQL